MEIKAENRTKFGKKAKLLRDEELVPAVVYGKETKSTPLSVNVKNFRDVYSEAGSSTLIDLAVEKKKPVKVLIQEVQKDPLTGDFLHVSFYQMDLKKDMTATIPVEIENEEKSPAVEEEGGLVIQPIDEIEIRCKPLDLPSEIVVDAKDIHVGDSISLADIKLPKGVELVHEEDKEQILATGTMPTEEIEEEEPEEELAEGEEGEVPEGEEGEEGAVAEGEEGAATKAPSQGAGVSASEAAKMKGSSEDKAA